MLESMLHESFKRLPIQLQQNVLKGLDEELQEGYRLSQEAAGKPSTSLEKSRLLADNVSRVLALRNSFTGEEGTTVRDLGIGTR